MPLSLIHISIYLTNGFQFKGKVRGFDNFTVILDCDGKQNLVYKHAISTIIPARPIAMMEEEGKAVSYTHLDVYKRQPSPGGTAGSRSVRRCAGCPTTAARPTSPG